MDRKIFFMSENNFLYIMGKELIKAQERIQELEAENKLLKQEIVTLKNIVHNLLARIEKLENPKNSRNSSIPPSKDENRPLKTKSLRSSTGKSVGGQKGHEGSTLKMTSAPDQIVEHKAQYCHCCGEELSAADAKLADSRQIIDIPPIVPQYTEHRIYRSVCKCGHVTKTPFPSGVNAPISYGTNVEALIAYMHSRQYIPFERMSEYFTTVCNLPISQGSINNILERFAQKAHSAYNTISERVQCSTVVGADETGVKVNGKLAWFWTWQTKLATYIKFSFNRGTDTIKENFSNGFANAVLVHDCWKSHFNTQVQSHQLCTAHLLRELKYFEERYGADWATEFKQMIYDALKLKDSLSQIDYLNPILQRTALENTLNELLQTLIPEKMKEVCSFQKRIIKYRDYLFNFLYYHDVPPDNNASERAIRNVKVKLKVSGQFKTDKGAQIYAIIRSITDTCIKNNQNILLAFFTIANLHPE